MPATAPAVCPSHNTSFPTLPCLLFAKREVMEWIWWFQSSTDEKRKRSQDMFWGHYWCNTWNFTAVAHVRQAELLGGQGRGLGSKHSFHFTWQFRSGHALKRFPQAFVLISQVLLVSHWNFSLSDVIEKLKINSVSAKRDRQKIFISLIIVFSKDKAPICLWSLKNAFFYQKQQQQ